MKLKKGNIGFVVFVVTIAIIAIVVGVVVGTRNTKYNNCIKKLQEYEENIDSVEYCNKYANDNNKKDNYSFYAKLKRYYGDIIKKDIKYTCRTKCNGEDRSKRINYLLDNVISESDKINLVKCVVDDYKFCNEDNLR
jgi:hypothetical protein